MHKIRQKRVFALCAGKNWNNKNKFKKNNVEVKVSGNDNILHHFGGGYCWLVGFLPCERGEIANQERALHSYHKQATN